MMNRTFLLCCLGAGCALSLPQAPTLAAEAGVITTGTLLEEMTDLDRLARWPEPAYRTIQFSSYDRRSTTSEAPGWFSNADGFGREPIPGFLKVLREPRDGQRGLYLLAEVEGPGAIVRGWSAGMGGVLRVYLDPPRRRRLRTRARWFGKARPTISSPGARAITSSPPASNSTPGDAFSQQDADYLPIPFARGLRVTWEGKLNELHFYHLQVRLYPKGTAVRTFDPKKDLKDSSRSLRAAVAGLTQPGKRASRANRPSWRAPSSRAAPGRGRPEGKGPGAVRELKLRLQADPLDAALRGCLLADRVRRLATSRKSRRRWAISSPPARA